MHSEAHRAHASFAAPIVDGSYNAIATNLLELDVCVYGYDRTLINTWWNSRWAADLEFAFNCSELGGPVLILYSHLDLVSPIRLGPGNEEPDRDAKVVAGRGPLRVCASPHVGPTSARDIQLAVNGLRVVGHD